MDNNIKYLMEEIQMFNPAEYDNEDIIDNGTINKLAYKYHPSDRSELISIIKEKINTQKNKDVYNIDLTDTDTSKVTDMEQLFSYALNRIKKPVLIGLDNWDVSNVTSMSAMFGGCESIQEIDMRNWDTSNVGAMNDMFYHCRNLWRLDLSSFNTSKVFTMKSMFEWCESLTQVNLAGWDTSNVKEMDRMFYECRSLKSLDISHFNFKNVHDFSYMLYNCNKLTDFKQFNIDDSLLKTSFFNYVLGPPTSFYKHNDYLLKTIKFS